jgi:hypothetical protein
VGELRGRVITEALVGGPSTIRVTHRVAASRPAASGYSTVLMYQVAERRLYFDEACLTKGRACN